MQNTRVDSPAIRIALLCCFALAIVPRATVYTHSHGGESAGHVHSWDGARLDSVRELIDEARGGHAHAHPHQHDDHDHDHDLGHQHATAAAVPRSSAHPKGCARGPELAANASAGQHHSHSQAPFQSIARASAVQLAFHRLQAPRTATVAVRPRVGARPALRARAPPLSVQA